LNLLKHATVPFVFGTQPPDEGDIERSERVLWIHTEIIIVQPSHPFRTMRGVVKDVLCNQQTPSGLRIVVQPNFVGLPNITLDYNSVVEARFFDILFKDVYSLLILTNSRGVKLYDHGVPPKSEIFIPRNKTSSVPKSFCALTHQPFVYPDNSPGYATPMPESFDPSSPAWDPSSRTPQHNSDDAESLASHSPPPLPFASGRVLLDLRLLGAQLRVSVTGGKFDEKELTCSVLSQDGQLSIRHQFYKSSETLLPEWVTPKYPSPTRDNGLLIVIKGDHCGKYVRRIHHRYEGEKAVVLLAVVNRVAGHVDSFTGEQLGLDISHLCVCEEPKEDKRLNASLMNALREEARKRRAK